MPRAERAAVSLLFLAVSWTLFHDYFPPLKRVILWGDIEGYHWPLLSYTFTSLREGRLPLWDPSIYCGIPFAANIQAGLFYPLNWVLFLAYAGRERLPFSALEALSVLHVWLALVFAYFWLRERTGAFLPASLGAAVAGCSGYMLSQMQHLGVTCAYAWVPFGLWGLEQADRHADWRPLWKLAVALCFSLLAGYPPTFAAFCLLSLLYAASAEHRRTLFLPAAGAVAVALLLSAIQIVPTMEAVRMKVSETSYGAPIPDHPRFYFSFLLPNFYNQNRTGPGPEVPEFDYMFLGSAAIFGLAYNLVRPSRRIWLPGISILGPLLWLIVDPGGLLFPVVSALPVLPDILRSYNLLLAFPFVAAMLTAAATEGALQRSPRTAGRLARFIWAALIVAWTAYLLYVARKGGPEFQSGFTSAAYVLVSVALIASGLRLATLRAGSSSALLLLLVFAEYRCFGVNRKGNAVGGNTDRFYAGDARSGGTSLNGLHDAVYRHLLAHPDYRVALIDGPLPTDLRFYRLASPQGFDPFLTDTYKRYVERFTAFRTNREFGFDITKPVPWSAFGVGYVMALRESEPARVLRADPAYELLQPGASFFQVFRVRGAAPAWRFAKGTAAVLAWTPEKREFRVQSRTGGTFLLLEQAFPGWRATVDGIDVPIQRAEVAFQSITVPAGTHTVSFRYQPVSVAAGAVISTVTLGAMVFVLARCRRFGAGRSNPAHAPSASAPVQLSAGNVK